MPLARFESVRRLSQSLPRLLARRSSTAPVTGSHRRRPRLRFDGLTRSRSRPCSSIRRSEDPLFSLRDLSRARARIRRSPSLKFCLPRSRKTGSGVLPLPSTDVGKLPATHPRVPSTRRPSFLDSNHAPHSAKRLVSNMPFHGVLVPFDVFRRLQRPTPGFPHPAVQRPQAFSTSRRFAPHPPSRPCFVPNPSMGFLLTEVSPSR